MTRRAAALLAAAWIGGCGQGAGQDWDGAVLRAVAQRAEAGAGERRLIVLERVGSPRGPELPFGARQALTTAGFQLGGADALERENVRVLVFEQVHADGADRMVDVVVHDTPERAPGGGVPVRWRVRCVEGRCEAGDSTRRAPT